LRAHVYSTSKITLAENRENKRHKVQGSQLVCDVILSATMRNKYLSSTLEKLRSAAQSSPQLSYRVTLMWDNASASFFPGSSDLSKPRVNKVSQSDRDQLPSSFSFPAQFPRPTLNSLLESVWTTLYLAPTMSPSHCSSKPFDIPAPTAPELDDGGRSAFFSYLIRILERMGNLWTCMSHTISVVVRAGMLALAWSVAQHGWVASTSTGPKPPPVDP
jgi:hypothetical protein